MSSVKANTTQAEYWLADSQWRVINDSVMGGLSQSKVENNDGVVRFSGDISLDNNGGFASTRVVVPFSVNNTDKMHITVRGDNKVYQLRLRVDDYFDGPAFVAEFKPNNQQWTRFEFNTSDFTLMYRGRTLISDYQLKFSDVTTVGFLIANKQSGAFTLDIKQVNFADDE